MDVFRRVTGMPSGQILRVFRVAVLALLVLVAPLSAQESPTDAPPAPEAAAAPVQDAPQTQTDGTDTVAPAPGNGAQKQMTLWDMVKAGGTVMAIIIALSVVALGMVIYFMLTLTPKREVPLQFVKRAQAQIRAGDLRGAYQMCEDRDEFIANVLRAGLRLHGHDRYVIQEAMESEGERRAAALWQKISYLNNIGVIAPMLGLLGTVFGMMGAFGAIAYNDAQSKSIVMAYNVAQAMVTTAGGLILGIVAVIFYYYLRGRVVTIIAHVEAHASEFVELLTGKGPIE